MTEIASQITSGVNWVVIFYILFALSVLIMANKFAGFDFIGIFSTLAKELADLSSRKFTYGSINIAGLIVITMIITLNLISDSFAEIISYAFAMKSGQNIADDNSLFMSVGAASLFTLISIIVVRASNKR